MEGILQLKKDSGGYRHYILLQNGKHHDLNCGSSLEVQMGEWVPDDEGERIKPSGWLQGRYEGHLKPTPEVPEPLAYLYIGHIYPVGTQLRCTLSLSVRVRKPMK